MRTRLTNLRSWIAGQYRRAKDDDVGGILDEYGLLTGVIAVAALGFATWLVANIQAWQDQIPVPGG